MSKYIYSVKVFNDFGYSHYPFESIREAYRKANSEYRRNNTCVVLVNMESSKILYSRCDNDFAVEQFIKYLDGKNNVLNEITNYPTV